MGDSYYSKSSAGHFSTVDVGSVSIGQGLAPVMIAGPCAVESEENIHAIAKQVGDAGAHVLRGGAFKPRTSPYSFQGHGDKALQWLHEAAHAHNMACVSEVMCVSQLEAVIRWVDLIQVGSRNMYNYALLQAVGRSKRPVMIKRGLSATYEEWLMAAEYVMKAGNDQVILCERGIRTHNPPMRNTLDLAAVPWLKQHTHLPIVVDPSHGTGLRACVLPMARAALAVGADAIMLEVHTDPDAALSDAQQTISVLQFRDFVKN